MKRNLTYLLSLVVLASLILSACGGLTFASSKKVAPFIWTQEFTTLNPMHSSGWFTLATQQFWDYWAWEYDENN